MSELALVSHVYSPVSRNARDLPRHSAEPGAYAEFWWTSQERCAKICCSRGRIEVRIADTVYGFGTAAWPLRHEGKPRRQVCPPLIRPSWPAHPPRRDLYRLPAQRAGS